MPNFSLLSRAYWRQSLRTTQPRQTSLASRVRTSSFGEEQVGIDAKAVGGPLPRRYFAFPAEPVRVSRQAQIAHYVVHRRLPSLWSVGRAFLGAPRIAPM